MCVCVSVFLSLSLWYHWHSISCFNFFKGHAPLRQLSRILGTISECLLFHLASKGMQQMQEMLPFPAARRVETPTLVRIELVLWHIVHPFSLFLGWWSRLIWNMRSTLVYSLEIFDVIRCQEVLWIDMTTRKQYWWQPGSAFKSILIAWYEKRQAHRPQGEQDKMSCIVCLVFCTGCSTFCVLDPEQHPRIFFKNWKCAGV